MRTSSTTRWRSPVPTRPWRLLDELKQAAARRDATPPINIPMVGGAIALAYNLEGVDNLILTPEVVQDLQPEITNWNDLGAGRREPRA